MDERSTFSTLQNEPFYLFDATPMDPNPSEHQASLSVDKNTTLFIYISGTVGIFFAIYLFSVISHIQLPYVTLSTSNGSQPQTQPTSSTRLLSRGAPTDQSELPPETSKKLIKIYNAIREGADSFLKEEYRICAIFIFVFGAIVLVLTSRVNPKAVQLGTGVGIDFEVQDEVQFGLDEVRDGDVAGKVVWDFKKGGLTAAAFVVGAFTSIFSGWLGMKVAVFSNARTALSAMKSYKAAFNTAFHAGGVMGFSLCSLALMVLYSLILVYNYLFYSFSSDDVEVRKRLFECIAGFGLGGSSVALFGRVGGGIYTKAADVGADLAGKVVRDIPEDDPRNPAVIADNVGDNVGDVAGMGSDLFGSFAEASCAALVITAATVTDFRAQMFPLLISALGIFVCLLVSFVATHFSPVRTESHIERVLKVQLGLTALFMTFGLYFLSKWCLPKSFIADDKEGSPSLAYWCVLCGLWSGCLIGFITEYFTSHSYTPTQEVAAACHTGAATNIIYGLALGYKSAILPVFLLAGTVFVTFSLLGMYGIALAALGMLSTLATCLTIDVYGPVCDNAGGIAEMSGLGEEVREKTDALDAAGNTTAAIGKGFAIGSACLVGLALFGAFVKRCNLSPEEVSVLNPTLFAFILIGAMIPYWFSALTMKSVGVAAKQMVAEVERQFNTIPGLLEGYPGHDEPDHAACIKISTDASLREMIFPGVLVITSPLLAGSFFGTRAVCGLLTGAISSSVQLAISASNTGGAWDNAKKYVEKGRLEINGVIHRKGGEVHKAAVVGDTVGDPLKDTSGPALNIVMKLMAILSLVLADFFMSINNGNGLIHWKN